MISRILQFFGLVPPYDPDIIDPHEFEMDLLHDKDTGAPPRPVPCIPSLIARNWTCAEMKAMQRNRRLLLEIWKRVYGNAV